MLNVNVWICLYDFCASLFIVLLIMPCIDLCVSNHTVVLVAVFLHKSPFPPYQRGFFCTDNSIKLTYKSSTVSNTVLTAVGVTAPVVSVSPAVVLQDNERAYVGAGSVHPPVGVRHLRAGEHSCQRFPKPPTSSCYFRVNSFGLTWFIESLS